MIAEKGTILSSSIALAQQREKLDACCKRLLANKVILAWIMKNCMEEYREFTVSEIAEKYIEGKPQIAGIAVHQDEALSELITGMGTESTSVQEGTVTYDIRFWALAPRSGELIRLIINIEAQNDYYPGYPLIKRGVYYGSRMISSQYGTEFVNQDYSKLKKVYSVWLCLSPPKYRQNTIAKYSLCEENMVGTVNEKRQDYDLMTIIMICLGDEKQTESQLLKLLDVIFSEEKNAEVKKEVLKEELGINMSKEMEMEMTQMCNYSKGVLEAGIEKGTVTSIRNLIESMGWTVDQAMEVLKIPDQKREEYRKILELTK